MSLALSSLLIKLSDILYRVDRFKQVIFNINEVKSMRFLFRSSSDKFTHGSGGGRMTEGQDLIVGRVGGGIADEAHGGGDRRGRHEVGLSLVVEGRAEVAARIRIWIALEVSNKNINLHSVINDPQGQTHCLTSSEYLKIVYVFCDFEKWGRTDNMCKNSNHLRP